MATPYLNPITKKEKVIKEAIKALGYESGSGVMIGIPGQTHQDLADDVARFRELDLDMIGVGPFIPHPGTPLGQVTPEADDQIDGILLRNKRCR